MKSPDPAYLLPALAMSIAHPALQSILCSWTQFGSLAAFARSLALAKQPSTQPSLSLIHHCLRFLGHEQVCSVVYIATGDRGNSTIKAFDVLCRNLFCPDDLWRATISCVSQRHMPISLRWQCLSLATYCSAAVVALHQHRARQRARSGPGGC